MATFFLGYASAVGTYLLVGLVIAMYVVWTNLARFHADGFSWWRMVKHSSVVVLFWPAVFLEESQP